MTDWVELILPFIALVMAIILHEVSHGYVALALGDDTAKSLGRLSLNPLVHVDRVGTIILPGIFLLAQAVLHSTGGVFFGWAKPVPIAPWRFSDPRRGMMLVALAGPLMNFTLAFLTLLSWNVMRSLGVASLLSSSVSHAAWTFTETFLMANMVLGTFNLLPIPPLDGGRVVVGLLPERLALAWARLERAGIIIVLLLIFALPPLLSEFGIAVNPLTAWLQAVGDPIFSVLDAAAGHPRNPFLSPRVPGWDAGV